MGWEYTNKTMTEFKDDTGVEYVLKPQQYNVGQHACVGCAFKFGGSHLCAAAPTCTPAHWDSGARVLQGPHVWVRKDGVK
jgi:hypothetical protein